MKTSKTTTTAKFTQEIVILEAKRAITYAYLYATRVSGAETPKDIKKFSADILTRKYDNEFFPEETTAELEASAKIFYKAVTGKLPVGTGGKKYAEKVIALIESQTPDFFTKKFTPEFLTPEQVETLGFKKIEKATPASTPAAKSKIKPAAALSTNPEATAAFTKGISDILSGKGTVDSVIDDIKGTIKTPVLTGKASTGKSTTKPSAPSAESPAIIKDLVKKIAAAADKYKPFAKYGMHGSSVATWNGFTKGDKIGFNLKDNQVTGEFIHFHTNKHSPNGYAVIRYEGKIYERVAEKVNHVAPTVVAKADTKKAAPKKAVAAKKVAKVKPTKAAK